MTTIENLTNIEKEVIILLHEVRCNSETIFFTDLSNVFDDDYLKLLTTYAKKIIKLVRNNDK
jgi:hypothetical protein